MIVFVVNLGSLFAHASVQRLELSSEVEAQSITINAPIDKFATASLPADRIMIFLAWSHRSVPGDCFGLLDSTRSRPGN